MRLMISISWPLRARLTIQKPSPSTRKNRIPTKMRMPSSSSGGKTWLAGTKIIAPTRKIAVRRTSRLRNITSAAADVSPQAGHWSVSRSEPQSRHRVIAQILGRSKFMLSATPTPVKSPNARGSTAVALETTCAEPKDFQVESGTIQASPGHALARRFARVGLPDQRKREQRNDVTRWSHRLARHGRQRPDSADAGGEGFYWVRAHLFLHVECWRRGT